MNPLRCVVFAIAASMASALPYQLRPDDNEVHQLSRYYEIPIKNIGQDQDETLRRGSPIVPQRVAEIFPKGFFSGLLKGKLRKRQVSEEEDDISDELDLLKSLPRKDIVEPEQPAAQSRRILSKPGGGEPYDYLIEEAKNHFDQDFLSSYDLQSVEDRKTLQELLDKEQAKAAQYVYQVDIQDEISDSFLSRSEERNGLSTKGHYTYSDGFFQHHVEYVADEKGFRVTKMDSRPIGDGNGPKKNKFGRAIVQQYVAGVNTQYAIQAQPVEGEDGDSAESRTVEFKSDGSLDYDDSTANENEEDSPADSDGNTTVIGDRIQLVDVSTSELPVAKFRLSE